MQYKAMVISNQEVSPGYYKMRMSAPPELNAAVPGQFIMVKVSDTIDPLLRRPFGIFDIGSYIPEYPGATPQLYLEILYKVVGKGTGMLAYLHHGDTLDILAPLGKGFDLSLGNDKFLIGGGVGLAPLYFLAKELVKRAKVHLFVGGRTREDILCITEFERLGVETYVATDDGTLGERGLVTDVLLKEVQKPSAGAAMFACGPHPMLKAVAHVAGEQNIPCQVSMEAYMACGVGACLGCVLKGKNHTDATPDYRCVCKDGPVFAYGELKWD